MPTLHEEKGREKVQPVSNYLLPLMSGKHRVLGKISKAWNSAVSIFRQNVNCRAAKFSDLNCLHKPQTLIFAFFAHLKIWVEVCKVSSLNAKELADRGKVVHDIGKHLRTILQ